MLKISVVTVCYNMSPYIEQTMQSVLNQNYPNLEYIVIDGGSTDGTQQIVEKYRDKLAYYVSEPDKGMYDAINKGFAHATGDIIAWINADDIYMPWTLQTVNIVFSQFAHVDWICGRYTFLTESGVLANVFAKCAIKSQKDIKNGWCREGVLGPLMQENMFWRRSLLDKAGMLDSNYRLAGDFELWTRFAIHSPLTYIDIPLAAFRRRKGGLSIGQNEKYNNEVKAACKDKKQYPNLLWKIISGNRTLANFLRLIRYRKAGLIYFDPIEDEFKYKQFRGTASSHCLETMRIFH